jgi:KaiC/GvpD/RAD55 family RecA-like ATPase
MNDDAQRLLLAHLNTGSRVLSAWFDDAKFRAAWAPQIDLFCADWQRSIAAICAARGAQLTRDDLVMQLERQGKLKLFEHGAEGVLNALMAPTDLNPWGTVDTLRQVAGERLLIERLVAIRGELERGDGMAGARESLANALRDADFASGAKARTVRESLSLAYKHATEPKRDRGCRTICKRLDEAAGTIDPGSVWLLAAPTSWGKSSFIVGTANRALRDKKRPLIVTFEDPERMFGSRLLLTRTNVHAMRLREARLLNDEHRKLAAALADAEDVPWLLNAIGRSAEAVAADIRSLVIAHGIDLVMIDYMQRVRLAARSQDRRNEINTICYLFTDAIKESGAGGILFSQITEDSSGKLKARESEDLHMSAETVLFGKKKIEQDVNSDGKKIGEKVEREIWVEKVKEGPVGFTVPLNWNPHSACFISDYDADDRQQQLGLAPPQHDPSYDDFDNQDSA